MNMATKGAPMSYFAKGRSITRRMNWLATFSVICLFSVCVICFQAEIIHAADFPRLGTWFPELWGSATIAQAARYDFLVLSDDNKEYLPQLRAENPDQVQLVYQNASEVAYDPNGSPSNNEAVLAIPHQWFLTQVGSKISSTVDGSQEYIPVDNVTNSDGSATFEIGDKVLIEGETVLVTGIDTNARKLHVTRGYVRPAAVHAAGARIAAHISFWPDTWMLNVSAYAPKVTVDAAAGPENCSQYRARQGIQLVTDGNWHGILVDRGEETQSWLTMPPKEGEKPYARTIDPTNSNLLLSDYTAFDREWANGIRAYHAQLRAGLEDRPIVVNWGMPNYDVLNGNNFEDFPLADGGGSYRGDWYATVFGALSSGSYQEWSTSARSPNYSTIQTYDDDRPPPAGEPYVNRCIQPGFTPKYQKMRFGLTTALLADGYFSYEMSTNGHGTLCLMWFDEYDNAGKGRGYLGQPMGAPAKAVTLSTPELVSNGGFENGWPGWAFWVDASGGYSATRSLDEPAYSGQRAARVDVTQSNGVDWHVQLQSEAINVIKDREYTLSFRAKADRTFPFSISIQQAQDPWTSYGYLQPSPLTTAWRHYELTFIAGGTDSAAMIKFSVGEKTGSLWLDDVSLKEGSSQVWRRDFNEGIVIVNATKSTHQIPLGQPFRKIRGVQVPSLNDGSVVTHVTLPPQDGIILLRDTTSSKLAITVSGTGYGTVSSAPPGIGCSSGSGNGCAANFTAGGAVCLSAAPDWKSVLSGWGGDYTGTDNPACLSMDMDKQVSAAFNKIFRVRVLPGSNNFTGVQEAYDSADSGSMIQLQAYDFPEDLAFVKEKTITLSGGFDTSYSSPTGHSIIKKLTVSRGTLTIRNITIK
jgi:hypothetical protein